MDRRCLNNLLGLGGGTEEAVEIDGVEIGGEGVVGEGGVGVSRRSEVVPLLIIGLRLLLVGARHLTTTE